MQILPAQVRSAYEKTGLYPVRGRWGDGIKCGCPLTAIAVAGGLDLSRYEMGLVGVHVKSWFHVHWGAFEENNRYFYDFARGVDGRPVVTSSGRKAKNEAAWEDGRLAWLEALAWQDAKLAELEGR